MPRKYFDRMSAIASGPASYMQKRTRAVPCLYGLDERFRIMDRFDGYVQVLTLASPPIEAFGAPEVTRDLARLANDEMAELVERYPDRFLGFAASLAMNSPAPTSRSAGARASMVRPRTTKSFRRPRMLTFASAADASVTPRSIGRLDRGAAPADHAPR